MDNYSSLRPITESFLGLGWGSYFSDNSFHLDLSAGYNFNTYWSWNVANVTYGQNAGNLYLQGMNIQARFDF